MDSTPLVSVITPFYNTAEYLAECIESVLAQTYTNWEYVLVNNKSTDGSDEIARRYAERYPGKIRLVHTDTFLSQVENYNFTHACISPDSTYTKMVQADDWIFPDCLRQMAEVAEAHPRVGIISAYELEGDHVSLGGLRYPSPEVSGRDACRLYFEKNQYVFGTPTSLMFRSEIVRSRQPFYEIRWAPFEDLHVCFEVARNWNIAFVHQVLTFSRRDNESILSRIRPYKFEMFCRLSTVVEHGRFYLAEDEYPGYLKHTEREYFYFLGESAYQGKDEKFWNFHRERLATINYKIDSPFMAKWMAIVALDHLGNPKRSLEYLWERRRRLFSASSRFLGALGRIFNRKTEKPAPESSTPAAAKPQAAHK